MERTSSLATELAALTDNVEQSTRRLQELRGRAPELRSVAETTGRRLDQRTAELARAEEDAAENVERIVALRSRLGSLEDRMVSFRRRMAELANTMEPE